MPDLIFERFLENAAAEAADLMERSDVLRVRTNALAPATFLCEFALPYLARRAGGVVAREDGPIHAVIHFPGDYLRSTDSRLYLRVASVLTPHLVHPNVNAPAVCLGSAFRPATRFSVLARELYDIFVYANYDLVEANSLNPEACRLLRAHRHLLDDLKPLPLVRRERRLQIRVRT